MPQQDKIKREIDRIGMALAKLLSILLRKDFPNTEANVEFAAQLRSELDIDLDEFLAMSHDDSIHVLTQGKNFSIEHLRNFANILYELAGKLGDERKRVLLQKALAIYEYIDTHSEKTVYLDVTMRLKELQSKF